MAWLAIAAAIAFVVWMTVWFALALAGLISGYPVGRNLIRRTAGRLDERGFLRSDIEELNEAFSRVARSLPAD